MALTLELPDEAATRAAGRALGRCLEAGLVVALTGPLGAGKTTFVQGLASGLGVPRSAGVRSPTFSLVDEHQGRFLLLHADLFRLPDGADMEELGLLDALARGAVVAVEWAERGDPDWPADRLSAVLEAAPAGGRRLTLDAHGPRAAGVLRALGQGPLHRRRRPHPPGEEP